MTIFAELELMAVNLIKIEKSFAMHAEEEILYAQEIEQTRISDMGDANNHVRSRH